MIIIFQRSVGIIIIVSIIKHALQFIERSIEHLLTIQRNIDNFSLVVIDMSPKPIYRENGIIAGWFETSNQYQSVENTSK